MDATIDIRRGRMRPATLARFSSPQNWRALLGPTWAGGSCSPIAKWWSEAVGLAEDDGLLWWDKAGKTWQLTLAGLELVKRAA
jgi:hypothetical protein